MQAALFTAIVTAFVLDAMSDLDEDTATKLLRLLVEQSITNSTIAIPPPNPPPSILTVNSLWLLSIVSSLAATTWAILCLQWCAFLSDGVQAEDYEEMAERRQRRFEAVKRWRMHLIVAAIPFFLHISLFLFLAGLWLRLRDMNEAARTHRRSAKLGHSIELCGGDLASHFHGRPVLHFGLGTRPTRR
jgi:hypothetical protein